jgi:hypothetical protein
MLTLHACDGRQLRALFPAEALPHRLREAPVVAPDEASGRILAAWKGALAAPAPLWVEPARRAANRFLGAAVGEGEDLAVRLYLLPSEPERNGRFDTLSLGFPHTILECGAPPAEGMVERLYESLVHEAAHAGQGPRVDPLLDAHLATPEGRQHLARFVASPAAARQRRMSPGQSDAAGFRRHLRETIVHTLVYEGALREATGRTALEDYWAGVGGRSRRVLDDPTGDWTSADLYIGWILGGSAQLLPLARRYLAEGRPVDEAFVEAAFAAWDRLYGRWHAAAGDPAPPPHPVRPLAERPIPRSRARASR